MNLTKRTIRDLRASFEAYDHKPSPQMWEALTAVADTIERMAEGTLDRGTFYVSPLDPGVGKTQTIVHAVRNLSKDVGVLICVSRLEEIRTLIREMELGPTEVGVFTGDAQVNTLGSSDPDAARVMFTTQQMVDSRLKDGKRFEALDVFYFNGRPRQVRIWDEAMLPGLELTLNVDAISRLPSLLRRLSYDLAEGLLDLVGDLREASDESVYEVPDIEGTYGVELKTLKAAMDSWQVRDREAAETLWRLSGKEVTVRHDPIGNTILDYREHLPDDFAPVLILDASARVRTTYRFWAESRGNLIELTKAHKRYDNLTIHHWNTGGGKNAFRKKQEGLIEGVAAAINSKPDEDWLVVVHKADGYKIPDLSAAIGDLTNGDRDRVKYLTWGNHHATNDYVGIKNVVLAGILFYPPSIYEVRARASKALPPHERLDFDDYRQIELGEHSHLILQAACRGAVRKCIGAVCAPCDLYLIAANSTGIPFTLGRIFPGSNVVQWEPVERPLRGKVGEAVSYLCSEFSTDDPNRQVAFKDHQRALGISDRANYNKNIRQHPMFVQALEKMQVVEVAKGRYLSHYARQPF